MFFLITFGGAKFSKKTGVGGRFSFFFFGLIPGGSGLVERLVDPPYLGDRVEMVSTLGVLFFDSRSSNLFSKSLK